MTHRHKHKSARRRAKARIARQAWKNYAALNSWKAIFDGNYVQVVRKLDGIDQHSAKISIHIHPASVIKNPALIGWITRDSNMESWANNAADKIRKTIDNHLIDAFVYGNIHSYRVRRAPRAK